ncbi:MAG TPA: ATP-grasp domain-containing protein [Ktedonobacterales bacterium]|nr:ATP-grasp domain-containing protein [Ktedonobacterales bacterium]
MDTSPAEQKRVLLLFSPASYRTLPFVEAANRLGLEVVQGMDMPEALADFWHVPLGLDFGNLEQATRAIVDYAAQHPLHAILSVDDSASLLAARASAALGLPHNSPDAALAARDKYVMRRMLADGGVPVPRFQCFAASDNPTQVAAQVEYPCVVKPLRLSGSRGVIRANSPEELIAAFTRTRRMLLADGSPLEETSLLVERFIPGFEVALEGILTDQKLKVLALFDKPDPLDGPFFEETIYVTPSRLPGATQAAIAERTAQAAAALGLRTGPIHAELRVNDAGPWIVEIAGRSIGGLCSTILQFGVDMCLEELILRQAIGLEISALDREDQAVGVMMIPIPGAGMLRGVQGAEEVQATPGIVGFEMTARLHNPVVPLPEGDSYLGFLFARGESPAQVEAALRAAHSKLKFAIDPLLPVINLSTQPHRPSATADKA